MSPIRAFAAAVVTVACCFVLSSSANPAMAGEAVSAAAASTSKLDSPEAIVDAQLAAYNKRDRFVIDHERVVAPPAKGELEAVAVYEVKDGKIARVTFLEK